MLPSPATERTKSKNIPLDLQLTSCEAQRDLVFARARQPLKPAQPPARLDRDATDAFALASAACASHVDATAQERRPAGRR